MVLGGQTQIVVMEAALRADKDSSALRHSSAGAQRWSDDGEYPESVSADASDAVAAAAVLAASLRERAIWHVDPAT